MLRLNEHRSKKTFIFVWKIRLSTELPLSNPGIVELFVYRPGPILDPIGLPYIKQMHWPIWIRNFLHFDSIFSWIFYLCICLSFSLSIYLSFAVFVQNKTYKINNNLSIELHTYILFLVNIFLFTVYFQCVIVMRISDGFNYLLSMHIDGFFSVVTMRIYIKTRENS